MERVMMIQGTQATLRYSNLMERDMKDNNEASMQEHQVRREVGLGDVLKGVVVAGPSGVLRCGVM
jgi:hypothetical protein